MLEEGSGIVEYVELSDAEKQRVISRLRPKAGGVVVVSIKHLGIDNEKYTFMGWDGNKMMLKPVIVNVLDTV